jgi:acetyl-CoA carboxylase biotin carboxyl carrier protein
MDLKEIKAIIDLMRKHSLTEFELEKQDFKIKLKRGGGPLPLPSPDDSDPSMTGIRALPDAGGAALVPGQLQVVTSAPVAEGEIHSPTIGTFYRAPSPDAAPYVEIGSEVGPETVVCVIEAMKVMSEIKAETRGIISSILVENGKPVEFGQLLFKLRPI